MTNEILIKGGYGGRIEVRKGQLLEIVNVEGETARGRWTITEYARTRKGSPLFTMGAYRDDYCKEGGRWRFQRRRFSAFYMGPPDMSGTLMPVPEDLGEGLEDAE